MRKSKQKIEVGVMQKCVDLGDVVKSFQTKIYLQNSASIQPRTSPPKFGCLPASDPPLGRFNSPGSRKELRTAAKAATASGSRPARLTPPPMAAAPQPAACVEPLLL